MQFNSKEELLEHAPLAHGMKPGNMEMGSKGGFLKRIPIGGAIVGGIVGGILMAIILAAGGIMLGVGAGGMFMVIGVGLGAGMMSATGVGLVLHFVVAIVASIIFGLAVYAIKPFRKLSTVRGLGLGALYGTIVYLVFFLPMAMKFLAPTMMMLMGPKASMVLGTVLAMAYFGHLVYGLTLGYTTFAIAKTTDKTKSAVPAYMNSIS